MKKILTAGALAMYALVTAAAFLPSLAKADSCSINVFWRWKDGKDYSVPPETPIANDKVKAVAQFSNCNLANNKVYFKYYTPSGEITKGLNPISSTWVEQWADFQFGAQGNHSFKAFLESSVAGFEKGSSVVYAKWPSAVQCNTQIQFFTSTTQLNSVDQSVTLKANISQKTQSCGTAVFDLDFLADGRSIKNYTRQTATYGNDQMITFNSLSASGMGYKANDTITFTAKVSGTVEDSNGTNQNFSLNSSPVKVGVGFKPTQDTGNTQPPGAGNGTASGAGNDTAKTGAGNSTPPGAGNTTVNNYTAQPEYDCTQPNPDPRYCLKNPLPVDGLTDMVLLIMRGFTMVVAIWAVLFIIIGGFRMVIAAGNEEAIGVARKTITWAVLGLIIAMMAFSIVAIVQNFIGARAPGIQPNNPQGQPTSQLLPHGVIPRESDDRGISYS